MKRCALLRLRIMWSSVATRYQLGLVRHAGWLTAPPSASRPQGTWKSAMNWAFTGSTSAANAAANFVRCRGTAGRPAAAGSAVRARRAAGPHQSGNRFARVGRERRDVDELGNLGMIAGLGDHHAAVGMADQHDRAVGLREDLVGRGDVAGQGQGGVLDDRDGVALRVRMLETPSQPEPSTKPPCTRTTLGFMFAIPSSWSYRARHGRACCGRARPGGSWIFRSEPTHRTWSCSKASARHPISVLRRTVLFPYDCSKLDFPHFCTFGTGG